MKNKKITWGISFMSACFSLLLLTSCGALSKTSETIQEELLVSPCENELKQYKNQYLIATEIGKGMSESSAIREAETLVDGLLAKRLKTKVQYISDDYLQKQSYDMSESEQRVYRDYIKTSGSVNIVNAKILCEKIFAIKKKGEVVGYKKVITKGIHLNDVQSKVYKSVNGAVKASKTGTELKRDEFIKEYEHLINQDQ